MPWVRPLTDTTEFIKGESAAGILRASDHHGVETDLFIWFAKAHEVNGVAVLIPGGPGAAASQNMLKVGPCKFNGSHLIPNSDADLTAIGLHVVVIDLYANCGFSSAAEKDGSFPWSDRQCAETAAHAVAQMATEGTVFSPDLPIVFVGVSYGCKIAAMAGDVLLETHPEMPLHAVVLDAALLDRIGITHGWTSSFLRFLQEDEEICKRLLEADLDALQMQVAELHAAGDFRGSSECLETLWSLTAEIIGAKNQWNLSPTQKAKGTRDFFQKEMHEFLASNAEQLGIAPDSPKFVYFNADVFMAFDKTCRLQDGTFALTRLREKGVRALILTAEWDAMATIEGIDYWLGKHFSGTWQKLELKTPEESLMSAQATFAKSDLLHAVIGNCGHCVLTSQPHVFAGVLGAFLNLIIHKSQM